jgi:hypothetical protein
MAPLFKELLPAESDRAGPDDPQLKLPPQVLWFVGDRE